VTDFSALTNEELNERVAQTCGWSVRWGGFVNWPILYGTAPDETEEHSLQFSSSLDACFGPHGPVEWLREHDYRVILQDDLVVIIWKPGPLRYPSVEYRDGPHREARALCEAFCELVERRLRMGAVDSRNRHMEDFTCWGCGAIVSAVVPVCLATHGEMIMDYLMHVAETRRSNYETDVQVVKRTKQKVSYVGSN
jgi:hypothetical protein